MISIIQSKKLCIFASSDNIWALVPPSCIISFPCILKFLTSVAIVRQFIYNINILTYDENIGCFSKRVKFRAAVTAV